VLRRFRDPHQVVVVGTTTCILSGLLYLISDSVHYRVENVTIPTPITVQNFQEDLLICFFKFNMWGLMSMNLVGQMIPISYIVHIDSSYYTLFITFVAVMQSAEHGMGDHYEVLLESH